MCRITLIVGKRCTGKTTAAKERTVGRDTLVITDSSYVAEQEWRNARCVVDLSAGSLEWADKPPQCVVWEANADIPRPAAQFIVDWCRAQNVEDLFILAQYERLVPRVIQVQAAETVRLDR